MKKSMITGIAIGAVLATAGGVYSLIDKGAPSYAEVVKVDEIKEIVKIPREDCQQIQVTKQNQPKDQNQILGTVTGAVVGGVLGNQVGGGSGKNIATAAGAVAGAYAGKKTQENIQSKNTYETTETKCETVFDEKEVISGYNVTYRIGDKEGKVRMDHDPGDDIPLDNGELKLD